MLIDLGEWFIGQEVPIVCQATDGTSPAWPDRAPVLALFSGSTIIKKVLMPADSLAGQPGVFRLPVFLDVKFPTSGPICGYVQWSNGGNVFSATVYFRILPGGSVDGSIVAMTFVSRPNQSFLVWEADSSNLYRGTNPRASR